MSLVLSAPLKNGSKGLVQTAVFPPKNWLTTGVKKCAENTNRLSGILLWHLVVSGNCVLIIRLNPQIQCFPIFQNFKHSPWFLHFKTSKNHPTIRGNEKKNSVFNQTALLQSGLWFHHHHHHRYYYYYYRTKTFFKILHIICLVVIVPQWILI